MARQPGGGGDGHAIAGGGGGVEDFPADSGQSAAEAFGDERLRMQAEPKGGGIAFQQIGDCWKRAKQILFLIRHVIGREFVLAAAIQQE